MIGLIVGLIVAFKPESKAPAVSVRAILIDRMPAVLAARRQHTHNSMIKITPN